MVGPARLHQRGHVAGVQVVQDALLEVSILELPVLVLGQHAGQDLRPGAYFGYYLLYLAVVAQEEVLGLVAVVDGQALLLDLALVLKGALVLLELLNQLNPLEAQLADALLDLIFF